MKWRLGLAVFLPLLISGCGQTSEGDYSATPSTNDELSDDGSPPIYAMATDVQVASAQSAFALCAQAVADLEAAKEGGVGKAYNAAKAASSVCANRVEDITDVRNSAKADFRLTDCREAALAGKDLADGTLNVLEAPTAENYGKLETLTSGFRSMAETCRHPEEYMLSRAQRR